MFSVSQIYASRCVGLVAAFTHLILSKYSLCNDANKFGSLRVRPEEILGPNENAWCDQVNLCANWAQRCKWSIGIGSCQNSTWFPLRFSCKKWEVEVNGVGCADVIAYSYIAQLLQLYLFYADCELWCFYLWFKLEYGKICSTAIVFPRLFCSEEFLGVITSHRERLQVWYKLELVLFTCGVQCVVFLSNRHAVMSEHMTNDILMLSRGHIELFLKHVVHSSAAWRVVRDFFVPFVVCSVTKWNVQIHNKRNTVEFV